MAEGISSFWGPVTSTIEGCEKNYAYSSYIAEFYNTISNIPTILLALFGLINALRQRFEKRFTVLHISNIILAIGNMLYHATLQRGQQQSDETPMVWEILLYIYILYSPDWHYRSTMPTFLFLYGASFAVVHAVVRLGIGFKVHYVILCLLCIPRMYKYYIHTQDASAKRLARLYVATLLLASLCWLCDRAFCKEISSWPVNPQGHAMWHIFMGFSSYSANTFLMFCRAQQREWAPKVVYFMGFLPYVKIEKSKTQ
ncbi:alkaline ceramidase-like [Juglans microcarpa x Juglans regia]|uniref:alkaline ceramidase-like n=1 Tax=Juglans microcarpa x Juglans regia TaxID=2249226 RepID=UPI001B7F62F0|nr:alkaline ceramidase-like [Juglans microcarpa x Juglans regia]